MAALARMISIQCLKVSSSKWRGVVLLLDLHRNNVKRCKKLSSRRKLAGLKGIDNVDNSSNSMTSVLTSQNKAMTISAMTMTIRMSHNNNMMVSITTHNSSNRTLETMQFGCPVKHSENFWAEYIHNTTNLINNRYKTFITYTLRNINNFCGFALWIMMPFLNTLKNNLKCYQLKLLKPEELWGRRQEKLWMAAHSCGGLTLLGASSCSAFLITWLRDNNQGLRWLCKCSR